MIFKDRRQAGELLAARLIKQPDLKNPQVVSLLRGGAAVGAPVATALQAPHRGLPVAKMSVPGNPELAMGAWCFGERYFDRAVIEHLNLEDHQIREAEKSAQEKFQSYLSRFGLQQSDFAAVSGADVILVDDGIATGASIKAAVRYIGALRPRFLVLAVPVAPQGFHDPLFDLELIVEHAEGMRSVSQYYESFPQLDDEEVRRLLTHKISLQK